MDRFVVKMRNVQTRSWGSETEVTAPSAQAAAEQLAEGASLTVGPGERADLRASVWITPYGSAPPVHFYAKPDRSP